MFLSSQIMVDKQSGVSFIDPIHTSLHSPLSSLTQEYHFLVQFSVMNNQRSLVPF